MPSTGRIRCLLCGVLLLLAAGFAESGTATAADGARRPLPASDYAAQSVCGAPSPGRASCLAIGLLPATAAARAHSHPLGMTLPEGIDAGSPAAGAYGLRPEDLHGAYELPLNAPSAQTIAIVDAYDDPTAEADLRVYDETFGLPACTTANGCFHKVNQEGNASPLPAANGGWAAEISLDIETAHAVCQDCQILLVETDSNFDDDLEAGVEAAAADGATEISNSYGGPSSFEGSAYDQPGIAITASTGDWGYDNWVTPSLGQSANYPASSPHVVAVGGTSLSVFDESWDGESAWYEGGSGCSTVAAAPAWQSSVPNWAQVGCGAARASADVAADADPYTGVAIYDSTPDPPYFPGWATMGGTSLSAPLVAAAFALAGGSHGVEYPAQTLYSKLGSAGLHDVVTGSNWGCAKIGSSGFRECTAAEEAANCSQQAICNAGPGYDGPTGVGTPAGLAALEPGSTGPAPTVTAVSPAAGTTAGGTTVTVSGTNLEGAQYVRFDGVRATILSDEEESVTVRTPTHEPGSVDVAVTNSEGIRSATSSADRYQYVVPEPSVTGVEPGAGPASGGTTVTISGANLDEAEWVEFGGSYAPVLAASAGALTTLSPAHGAGPVDVTVVGPYGVSSASTASDRYTYAPAPAPQTWMLAVASSGAGHGWVFSSPPGIACEAACSYPFADGSDVVLTATPAAGSRFAGWSGAGCAGTGICELRLGGDASVHASFESTGASGAGGSSLVPANALQTIPAPAANVDGGTSAYSSCLDAARRAYLHAKSAALRAHGEARARGLKRAKRQQAKLETSCRKRFAGAVR